MYALFEPEYEDQIGLGLNEEDDISLILTIAKEKLENPDLELIERGLRYCILQHSGVFRKSGVPYYAHPVRVAQILLEEFPVYDSETVVACLLHDTIEDVSHVLKSSIEDEFGEEVASMVDGVTKISHEETSKLKNKAGTYRKLFLALVKDIRVIMIKLADRLHNIRTLHYLAPHKQRDIALETLSFYTPLAHRLGLNKIKMELENSSFYYSDTNAYEAIREALNEKRREFISYIRGFSSLIESSLKNQGIQHTLSIVHKHEYEIYGMLQDGKSITDIDNFYSIVIILHTNDVTDCYRTHGILANAFNTINFIDYIANPKLSWYKSLNSELFGPDGKRIEILIRTSEMEKIAEEGFASQFSLNQGRTKALSFTDDEIEAWGMWMQDIIETQGDNSSQYIWDSIKVNLFDSELTVFMRDGQSVNMPQGSSIIDLAFALSNEIGFKLISAKVNGLVVDINYKLQSGDQVEIIKSPNSKPRLSWKNNVVTHRAVISLHNYFKENPYFISAPDLNQKNFEVKLRIVGEDKEGMLQQITSAIGQTNMKRISLDSIGDLFQGIIHLVVPDVKFLNELFARILTISGIKSVERFEE